MTRTRDDGSLPATFYPDDDGLYFLPLGGSGEIGMNLNLYGHRGTWLMVDLGISYAVFCLKKKKIFNPIA